MGPGEQVARGGLVSERAGVCCYSSRHASCASSARRPPAFLSQERRVLAVCVCVCRGAGGVADLLGSRATVKAGDASSFSEISG